MNKKMMTFGLLFALSCSVMASPAHAAFKEGASSLLLPTTGQAMNGQLGAGKTKLMGGIEAASIVTTAILGITTGGATVLIGAIPLAANHLWSGVDAYGTAKRNQRAGITMTSQQELFDAQRNLEFSRDARFGREQDVRERIRRAGEMAN